MNPKFIILIFLFNYLIIRCSILREPLAESIAYGIIQVQNELQIDSCESNLIYSTISYRLINKEFPARLPDLYNPFKLESLNFLKNNTGNLKQLKYDSIDFEENFIWDYNCEKIFDSIHFKPYADDSLDLYWSKHRLDSILNKTVIDEKYRIRVQKDTINSFDCVYYHIITYDSLGRKIFHASNQELNKRRRRNKNNCR